jgi:tRNA A58 N-methylase Trm61
MHDKYNNIVSCKEADPVMMDVDACWELLEEIQNLLQHVAGYELVQKPNDSVLSYVHYKLKDIGKDLEHERRTDQMVQTHVNVGQGSRS